MVVVAVLNTTYTREKVEITRNCHNLSGFPEICNPEISIRLNQRCRNVHGTSTDLSFEKKSTSQVTSYVSPSFPLPKKLFLIIRNHHNLGVFPQK